MKQKRLIMEMFILVICIMILTSCQKIDQTESKPQWVADWLEKPICQPPCWEKVIPGVSTALDGIRVLDTLSDKLRASMPQIGTESDTVLWEMNECVGETAGMFVFKGYPDSTINKILLYPHCKEAVTNFQDIINIYGFPDYQWAENNPAVCFRKFLYLEQGMILEVFVASRFHPNEKLTPSSEVSMITFIPVPKSLDEAVNILHFPHEVDIREWQGYDHDPCME